MFHVSSLWTLQRLCFGPDVAAAYADRGENRDPGKATGRSKRPLTKEARLENGPSGSRASKRIPTGESNAIMCPALLMRHIDRWPRWGSRSGPKQSSDFESHWWQRVLRIVGSTTDHHLLQLFHLGTDARFRRAPAWRGRLFAPRHGLCQSGHSMAQAPPKPCEVSIAGSAGIGMGSIDGSWLHSMV